jgi:hypothetical protein
MKKILANVVILVMVLMAMVARAPKKQSHVIGSSPIRNSGSLIRPSAVLLYNTRYRAINTNTVSKWAVA